MLALEDKIEVFKKILSQEESSYADSFNANIDLAGSNCDYILLEKLNSENDIERWIEKLKSRIVVREDQSTLERKFRAQ